ncbi:MAG: SpoIIE family protein phosphatase [Limnochordia bacterium]|nr:SpoIIE family protein phosphatase [Bacillota bacterium]NLH31490.1 SpoIIE family protein phosphatase [Bacillota bacterium]
MKHEYRVVPLEVRRRSKARQKQQALALDVPVLTVLAGFFLARALLLDELLPFGPAFIAAVYRGPKPRPAWALLGVAAGYASLNPTGTALPIYPYYAATMLVWLAGGSKALRPKDSYWVFWFFAAFLGVRAPLTIRLLGSSYPMIWFAAVGEAVIAAAAYSMFSTFVHSKRMYALDVKEFQIGLMLAAVFVGADLVIYQFPLRMLIMFYLVLAAARIGRAGLALMIGPLITLIALLVKLPVELAVMVVVVAVAAGFLAHLPLGLLIASLMGYLLTFGLPVEPETVKYLLMPALAALAVYLTPAQRLRQLERLLPGTKQHTLKQASHTMRAQEILEARVEQFSQVFHELAAVLEESTFVAQQLENMAQIIAQLSAELGTQAEFAEAIEDKLWRNLDSAELKELTVLQQDGSFLVSGKCHSQCGSFWCNQVAKECGDLLGGSFAVTRRRCLVSGQCGFDISTKARYVVDVKTAKIAQGRVSGDSNAIFALSANRVGLLISDGMGTGERAASYSLATIRLLEKMIRVGYDPGLAVKVINQVLLARSMADSFATIDFVIVDLETGQLEFLKIGAAASFIKRGRNVEVVQNHALPVGILNHVEVEPERRLLYEGDYLVMVTDGVLESQGQMVNKEQWMCQILRRADDGQDCQEMANQLLLQSIEAAGGGVVDDMMVLVAKLVRNDPEIHPYQRS